MKHTGKWFKLEGSEIALINCKDCGFIHRFQSEDLEEIEAIYSTKYYDHIKPNFDKEHKTDKQWYDKIVYPDIFEIIESYLDKKQRRILDAGAGMLGFCQYAVKHGWDAVGLDPALQSYQKAQELKIDFYRGVYDENCLHLGIFDVINMHDLLEHIINPKVAIQQAYKQLEKQGILVITVANDFNNLQNGQSHFIVKEHINYFTIESLETLLQNNRFDILETRTSFPMELFMLMGIDYTKNNRTGRRVHNYRKQFELNLEKSGLSQLRKDFNQFWTDKGLGRDITIFARKI